MRVLLVENEVGFGRAVFELLTVNAHHPVWCRLGSDALLTHSTADLVLLSLDLPDMTGLEVLVKIRQVNTAPILAFSARHDENSTVTSLRSGADDYLAKPLRLRELLARIEVLARRRTPPANRRIEVMDVAIDIEDRVVWVAGRAVALTPTEFDVLAVLARRVGKAVSRQHIMSAVWGSDGQSTSRTLNVHMTSLRAKLNRPAVLYTIHRYGYRLGEPTQVPSTKG